MIKQLMIMPLLLANTTNTGNPFTLELTKGQTQTSIYEDLENTGQYRYASKINTAGNNEYLNISGSEYTQYEGITDSNNVNYVNVNYPDYKLLTIYAITPYNTVIDTDVMMETYIEFDGYNGDGATINTEILITTNQDWANYINIQNYGTQNVLQNIYENVTSPNAGYVYKEQTIQDTITNIGDYYTYVNFNVTLTKGMTTYVLIYSTITESINPIFHLTKGSRSIYQNETIIEGLGIIPTGQQEIIDMPGLMFYVITLPFTFISMAFNITLFPGTPYQINISNLLLAVIAILVFIFIMKLLISVASKMGGA